MSLQTPPQSLPKLYSLTAIGVATFLGSALAAGYMLASNYRALGQQRMGQLALIGSLMVVLAFVFLPTQLTPNISTAIVLMIAQVLIVLLIANKLQGAMFRSFEAMGGTYHSMRRTLWVGVMASVALTAASVLLLLLLADGSAPTSTGA